MGWGWPWARELGADTHRFSLGALFTFEASNARLALGKERADSRTGLSPQTLPPPPQTPLKAPPPPAKDTGVRAGRKGGGV